MAANGDDGFDLTRGLDWEFSYVDPRAVFPEPLAGRPYLPHAAWASWDEPFKTTYADYVTRQHEKDAAVFAVRDALGRGADLASLPRAWTSGLKLHGAVLTLAEFAAAIGNLRAARFGRTSAWRDAATLGALDEIRHTQIPLLLDHELVKRDPQFDFTHRFYHSDNWVAIAARHFADELLLGSTPLEFAIGTNFVFETGFTNLQFVALSSLARDAGDRMFETMVTSIQTDEARHAQIGSPVLATLVAHDRAAAQKLVDKWFWRSWLLFAVMTGFTMDYLTPLEHRTQSFREFVDEWVRGQFLRSLEAHGLERPWYWDTFLEATEHYHHMVYASAYTYRASVWFDLVVPGPRERAWLRQKYPRSWDDYAPVWERITERWRESDVGNEFAVHGTAIVSFCNLCQLVLSNGTPRRNTANVLDHGGRRYVFCSEPCRRIFLDEPARYEAHEDVVKRVLAGKAPGNLIGLVRETFGLDHGTWGQDALHGDYPWLRRGPR